MPKPRRALVDEVIEAHRAIMRGLHQAAGPSWLEVDLTMAQLKTLIALADQEPITIGQLAGALSVSLPTASHLADRLVHAGLVQRAEDPGDRRRTLVSLTPQGQALVGRLRDGGREHFRVWLSRLSEEDLGTLLRGLQALAEASKTPQTVAMGSAGH
ncbi:MAG: MarR family transcriptional regulator [Ardenticatenaceae bacterium]|nr:MarR family transcriptional regulator [Ardenticatenaceae bacterium]